MKNIFILSLILLLTTSCSDSDKEAEVDLVIDQSNQDLTYSAEKSR